MDERKVSKKKIMDFFFRIDGTHNIRVPCNNLHVATILDFFMYVAREKNSQHRIHINSYRLSV